MATLNLEKLFNPKSVAIIGASDVEGSVGNAIVKNLTQRGYAGKVYFVNNRKPEILGVKTYAKVSQIGQPIDLAIIATPAKTVPEVMVDCGLAKVKGAIVVSAGFRETGAEGRALEAEILKITKKYEIRLIGPNCIGIIRPRNNLNATFIDKMPKAGNVAFITQSGALGQAILDWAIHQNIGFSNFASVGSMTDVDYGDLIDYFGTDPHTKSILMYVETITEARKFMSAARHFSRTKPIIVLKSGKFKESAIAAASHTGSLSSEDEIYDAAFKRAGVVRVEEIADLFNAAEVLSSQPLPKGPRLAIITNAGGSGVMAVDALIKQGGKLATLSQKTLDVLSSVLPSYWNKNNPIDLMQDAKAERYRTALEACLNDPNIDGILIIFSQQATPAVVEIANEIVEVVKSKVYQNKTILTCFMGYGQVQQANDILKASNIPIYPTPEQAIRTYMSMHHYQRNVELMYETPEELPVDSAPPKRPIMVILQNAALSGRQFLTEEEAKKVLKYYTFPVVKTENARTEEEAVAQASRIGYPVVLKINSPEITHKTEAGGVILNLHDENQVRVAFASLIKHALNFKPNAQILGVTVQSMVSEKGYEIMVGGKNDPVFGPIILFGTGGIGVELFKDYAIGLSPLNTTLILRMMEETKVYQLLKGYRNAPPADVKRLEEIMSLLSQLMIDFPQIKEIDINPILVNENMATILDARIMVDKEWVCRRFDPHEHLVISPYPKKYQITWRLKNGQEIMLRPIKPEDEPLWVEMYRSFSEESIRYRFFQMQKDAPHAERVRYCNIDYDREIAIVAETFEAGKKMLGVARLSIEAGGKTGELAFIVSDKWQGLGLGTKLVDYVLEIAKEMGVETVYAIMLVDNYRALNLTQKMGFKNEYQNDGTVKGILDLTTEIDYRCFDTETNQNKATNENRIQNQENNVAPSEAKSIATYVPSAEKKLVKLS